MEGLKMKSIKNYDKTKEQLLQFIDFIEDDYYYLMNTIDEVEEALISENENIMFIKSECELQYNTALDLLEEYDDIQNKIINLTLNNVASFNNKDVRRNFKEKLEKLLMEREQNLKNRANCYVYCVELIKDYLRELVNDRLITEGYYEEFNNENYA